MFDEIKKNIEKHLTKFLARLDKQYKVNKISPLLFESIQDFVQRDGKRIRPILFTLGYKGFSRHLPASLYTSALSIEIFHDFMLIHDDIIDKSDLRRGKPSMHTLLNTYLRRYKNIKFSGQDLSIVIGDIMFALSIDAFLSINVNLARKEKALKTLLQAAVYTGSGEFIELINGTKSIKNITQNDIFNVYDYKTAYYTFACPLAIGAILAGAPQTQITKLNDYGLYIGRAFQIKDDILGMFGDEKKIGKSILSDLQESKATLLVWYAFHNAKPTHKKQIQKILNKEKVNRRDLIEMQKLVTLSGGLQYAHHQIEEHVKSAQKIISNATIKKSVKNALLNYPLQLLK